MNSKTLLENNGAMYLRYTSAENVSQGYCIQSNQSSSTKAKEKQLRTHEYSGNIVPTVPS